MHLTEVTFAEVLPIWRDRLWPNRLSRIEPASSMIYLGGYNVAIKTAFQPRFFAVLNQGVIVGVNSGHQTSLVYYRSRGIWVDPACTLCGVGRSLIAMVEAASVEAGCDRLWSVPRQSAMRFYTRCGFVQTTDFFDETMEFGPNCYALKTGLTHDAVARPPRHTNRAPRRD